jgi:hypothetical protein
LAALRLVLWHAATLLGDFRSDGRRGRDDEVAGAFLPVASGENSLGIQP